MTIKQGDTVLASYPIAIGRPGHPTPTGKFHVIDMDENPAGAPNIAGRWLGFLHTTTKQGRAWVGIHGTQKIQSIGRLTSDGCIRVRIPDAIEAFSLFAIGDPIHIVGPPPLASAGYAVSRPQGVRLVVDICQPTRPRQPGRYSLIVDAHGFV